MPPAQKKRKFLPQSMTIDKCFAKQREKQKVSQTYPCASTCEVNQDEVIPVLLNLVELPETPVQLIGNAANNKRTLKEARSNENGRYKVADSATTPPIVSQFDNQVHRMKSVRRNLMPIINDSVKSAVDIKQEVIIPLQLYPHCRLKSRLTLNKTYKRLSNHCLGNNYSDSSDDDFLPLPKCSKSMENKRMASSSQTFSPTFDLASSSLHAKNSYRTPKRLKLPCLKSPKVNATVEIQKSQKVSATVDIQKSQKVDATVEIQKSQKIDATVEIRKPLSTVKRVIKQSSEPTTHGQSIFSPRCNNYLNLIPDCFNDIKLLLRSQTPSKSGITHVNDFSKLDLSSNNGVEVGGHQDNNSVGGGGDNLHYYLKNFLITLESVFRLDEEYALFDEDDLSFVRRFYLMSYKAQNLYVRLFSRQYAWIPTTKIKYSEIDDNLKPVLHELQCNDFLEFDENLTCLKTIINLMQIPQLKALCRNLNIKVEPQKAKMLDLVLNHCNEQRSAINGFSILEAVTVKAKKILQRCCRLLNMPRRIFLRILMLYSLTDTTDKNEDRPFQLDTLTRVTIGQLLYPQYNIFRRMRIFRFREDLMRYERAFLLQCEITSVMERKDWEKAGSLCDTAVEEFGNLISNDSITRHDRSLPDFLRKFTAGHLYVLCLNNRVDYLQKVHRYDDAVSQLQCLREQNIYCQHHIGHWMERIALNLDQHLDKPIDALYVIAEGLKDTTVTTDHMLALLERSVRIAGSRKRKAVMKGLILPPLNMQKLPEIRLEGSKLEQSLPGYKTSFVATEFSESGNDFDIALCSVEEFAIIHYKSKAFSQGLHGEGSTLVSLFGLLFWDLIYYESIPDAFRCNHQSYPLDLLTEDFYMNRKIAIHARYNLVMNSPMENIIKMMAIIWEDCFGQSSIVSWNLFGNFQRVQSLITCMGTAFLAKICLLFATNYRHYRGGVPDIVVWNPNNRNWKMVEVKGPRDVLSNKQRLWLNFLLENEVDAEVCYVKETVYMQEPDTPIL